VHSIKTLAIIKGRKDKNHLHNTTLKINDWATRNPQKIEVIVIDFQNNDKGLITGVKRRN
jgi:hypothetical protein